MGGGIPGKDTNVKDASENGDNGPDKSTVRNNKVIDWGKITDTSECWPRWSCMINN